MNAHERVVVTHHKWDTTSETAEVKCWTAKSPKTATGAKG